MKRLVAIVVLALSLAGCATPFGQRVTDVVHKVEAVASAISGATVSPEAVVIAANSFNALEATATNYLRLKRCTGSNGPICRDPAVTKQLVPAIRAGRIARDALVAFMREHPGQLGPSGLYDALTGTIETLQAMVAQHSMGAVP